MSVRKSGKRGNRQPRTNLRNHGGRREGAGRPELLDEMEVLHVIAAVDTILKSDEFRRRRQLRWLRAWARYLGQSAARFRRVAKRLASLPTAGQERIKERVRRLRAAATERRRQADATLRYAAEDLAELDHVFAELHRIPVSRRTAVIDDPEDTPLEDVRAITDGVQGGPPSFPRIQGLAPISDADRQEAYRRTSRDLSRKFGKEITVARVRDTYARFKRG